MLRTCSVYRNERQIDFGRGHSGKVYLSLFGSFLNTLHSHFIGRKIDTVFVLEVGNDPIHYSLIEVITAETVVTCRGKNLLHAVSHFDYRNIERTAAEVIYHDLLIVLFINAVCKSCGSRLVYDPLDVKTGYLTGVLGRLTLCVSEVCRNGYDCFGNGGSEVCLGICLQLLKNYRGYLLRCVLLTVDINGVGCAHLSLYRYYSSFRVGNSLTLCDLTHHSFARF